MKSDYGECLKCINDSWDKMTFFVPKDKSFHIGLPNKFVSPSRNDGIFGYDQFYWDSYFVVLGLIPAGRVKLARGMVENFAYLYERFNIMPSRNRFYDVGISQPPFFSSMVLEVFSKTKNKRWLRKMSKIAERELIEYWTNDKTAEVHLVHDGLSRYCDHYITHITSEQESGWDMTSRFGDRCLDILPVDLNSLLFKYESDLALIYEMLGRRDKADEYKVMADKRKKKINKYMWDEKKGFFMDYDYQKKKRSGFVSLAGFYPLWAGLATKNQAKRCRDFLKNFECAGGLANTQKKVLKPFRQWDYPNGWANQQWIVIKGLLNYGFREDAERIARKWLNMNKDVFLKTGEFWEKYNVVKMCPGKEGRYPNQVGFAWTNAVFLRLVSDFGFN